MTFTEAITQARATRPGPSFDILRSEVRKTVSKWSECKTTEDIERRTDMVIHGHDISKWSTGPKSLKRRNTKAAVSVECDTQDGSNK